MHHDGRHSAAASVARLAAETELNAYQDCTFARAIFAHQEVYILSKWDLLWFVVCGLLVYGVWMEVHAKRGGRTEGLCEGEARIYAFEYLSSSKS